MNKMELPIEEPYFETILAQIFTNNDDVFHCYNHELVTK